MKATRFIIVRHGESEWNLAGRFQGHLDSSLTETGTAQSRALAGRLREESFNALYSSDLKRAYQTAGFIARKTGHRILVDRRLRERNLGIFQGLTKEEIQKQFPEEYGLYQNGGADYLIPRGESARQQSQRVVACLEKINRRQRGGTVVVITHGGVLSVFLRHVLGIPLEATRGFKLFNAGLNVFSHRRGRWILENWGDNYHLNHLVTFYDQ